MPLGYRNEIMSYDHMSFVLAGFFCIAEFVPSGITAVMYAVDH